MIALSGTSAWNRSVNRRSVSTSGLTVLRHANTILPRSDPYPTSSDRAGASQLCPDKQATVQLPPADPYQAIPPFYLQDRFCTAKGTDADGLHFVTCQMRLDGTRSAKWKLDLVRAGPIAVR
jgi:hypothetical protein